MSWDISVKCIQVCVTWTHAIITSSNLNLSTSRLGLFACRGVRSSDGPGTTRHEIKKALCGGN